MKKCPYCFAELRDDDVFCYSCGREYKKPVMCKHCGTKLVEGAQYCLRCGEPVYDGRNPFKKYPNEVVGGDEEF